MLTIKNLTKAYGKKIALKDFSMEFKEGLYGILGANGAGKSTLMNLLTDNVARDSGEILYQGKEILEWKGRYRELIGYMPQQQGFYDEFSVEAFLRYMAELKGIKKKEARQQIKDVLEKVNLSEAAGKKIQALSGGMKQRVLLAQALLGSPKILILDEPSAGLDPKERIRLRDYIAELAKERIILLATHVVSDVESVADEVLLLKDGELVAHGSPAELIAQVEGKNLEDVYLHYFSSFPSKNFMLQ